MLEVVEDQQHLAVAEPIYDGFAAVRPPSRMPTARAMAGGDERRIDDGREFDERGASRKPVAPIGRDLDREAGLADAGRTAQRDESHAT